MRPVLGAVLVLIGVVVPALGADPPEKLSVSIRADKDAQATNVAGVLAAVRKVEGTQVDVTLGILIQKGGGISAEVRVPPETPHRRFAELLDALVGAGVKKVTLVVK